MSRAEPYDPLCASEQADKAGQTVPALDDTALLDMVEQYAAALNQGKRPDRQEILARHPEAAGDLQECLSALEFVCRNMPPIPGETSDQAAHGALFGGQTALGELGDFLLLREIGRGGMGIVYEAEQVSLHRRVALKTLQTVAVLDPKQLQRFRNEAMAAAALDHPHIVGIHSVGCERGVHYYAMHYIEGATLAKVIQELRRLEQGKAHRDGHGDLSRPTEELVSGRMAPPQCATGENAAAATPLLAPPAPATDQPPQPAASIAESDSATSSTRRARFFRSVAHLGIQAAEALEHAHRMGVVHRDIKPSNLLVDAQGHLWVTDFGLAMTHVGTNLTMSGEMLGTLRYMSPEQITGHRHAVDHHTDIYSLGLTLYELLTLRPAFDGEERPQVILAIQKDDLGDNPRPGLVAGPRDQQPRAQSRASEDCGRVSGRTAPAPACRPAQASRGDRRARSDPPARYCGRGPVPGPYPPGAATPPGRPDHLRLRRPGPARAGARPGRPPRGGNGITSCRSATASASRFAAMCKR